MDNGSRATGICRNLTKGFTLMELMIVIVVLAVLASIAIPSYRQYAIRANRTEATGP